jgi:3-methyladenine DNA glycosylase AlkC
MAELFKNLYDAKFFGNLIRALQQVWPQFEKTSFLTFIYDEQWDEKGLKHRMRHVAHGLKRHLPGAYQESIPIIVRAIEQLQRNGVQERSVEYMCLPEFVELFGLEHYDLSVWALEQITPFTSCEFAVRPFIVAYPGPMMAQMLIWSRHGNEKVRRLASEGCRPRLPWARGLPSLQHNPATILPILANLMDDESIFVRRSVANNLNDIAKDHPKVVVEWTKQWKGRSKRVDWVVKHACRTLLKQGRAEVLELFGFCVPAHLGITDLSIQPLTVRIGGLLTFTFKVHNSGVAAAKVRLEYGLYYLKSNGRLSRKVFKIGEREHAGKTSTTITRRHSFRIITTRKYHPGRHQLSVIVNGTELCRQDFILAP